MKPKRFKMVVSYDGTDYAGWQVQPHHVTVQQKLEEAVATLEGRSVKVHGSGRTDQGVHARGQVAHFDMARPRDTRALRTSLNALIPRDIRVMSVARVSDEFHARKSAIGKEYRYLIHNAEVMPPIHRRYRAHLRTPLDIDAMREAAAWLEGEHDFTSFTANARRVVETCVRNLSSLRVEKRGAEVRIVAYADGFLYKMVRSLAGWLIKVGEGRASATQTPEILEAKKRTATVETAASKGLFLWRVDY